MARYFLTSPAEQDVAEIVLHIAEDNIDAALGFKDRIYGVFEMLAENPLAGRDRSDLKEGIRSFPVGSYLILYRLWAGDVAIVRIRHAARDLDEIFS